jgi:hypothetical protein
MNTQQEMAHKPDILFLWTSGRTRHNLNLNLNFGLLTSKPDILKLVPDKVPRKLFGSFQYISCVPSVVKLH